MSTVLNVTNQALTEIQAFHDAYLVQTMLDDIARERIAAMLGERVSA